MLPAPAPSNPKFAFPLVISGFPNLIVNFVDNVTLTAGDTWSASILDPLGSVVGMHEITGDVVAMSFSNDHQTHFASV